MKSLGKADESLWLLAGLKKMKVRSYLQWRSADPAAKRMLFGCQSRLSTVDRMAFLMCLLNHLRRIKLCVWYAENSHQSVFRTQSINSSPTTPHYVKIASGKCSWTQRSHFINVFMVQNCYPFTIQPFLLFHYMNCTIMVLIGDFGRNWTKCEKNITSLPKGWHS